MFDLLFDSPRLFLFAESFLFSHHLFSPPFLFATLIKDELALFAFLKLLGRILLSVDFFKVDPIRNAVRDKRRSENDFWLCSGCWNDCWTDQVEAERRLY